MSLKGQLGTIPLPELLQWLAIGQKTGTLVIVKEDGVHRVVVDAGRVISTATSEPALQLSRQLIDRGRLDEEELRRALKLKEATEMTLGQVLLTLQLVSQDELREALRAKAEALISHLFHATDASFHFVEGGELEDPGVRLSLDATQLVLSAAHHLEDGSQQLPLTEDAERESKEGEPGVVRRRPRTSPPSPQAPREPSAPAAVSESPASPTDPVVEALPESRTAGVDGRKRALGGLAAAAVLIASLTVVLLVFRQDGPAEAGDTLAAAAATADAVGRTVPQAALGAAGRADGGADGEASSIGVTTPEALSEGFESVDSVPSPDGGETPDELESRLQAALAAREAELRTELDSRDAELDRLRRQLAEARATEQPAAAVAEPKVAVAESGARSPLPLAAEAVEPSPLVPAPPIEMLPVDPPSEQPEAERIDAGAAAAEGPAPEATDAIRSAPARLLSRPTPTYPPAALRLGREAEVTVRVLVGEDGTPQEVELVGRAPGMGFDRAAREAALASQWRPAVKGGVAVSSWVELRFSFGAPGA